MSVTRIPCFLTLLKKKNTNKRKRQQNKKSKHVSHCDKNYGGFRNVRCYPKFPVCSCFGNRVPLKKGLLSPPEA